MIIDVDGIAYLKSELSHRFEMKDLGTSSYFLGFKVVSFPRDYLISQSKCAKNVIEHAHLTNTPLEFETRYSPFDDFVSTPTIVHWAAIVLILHYLHATCFQSFLFLSTSSLVLRAYSDADWASNSSDASLLLAFVSFWNDTVFLAFVSSLLQLADFFTKSQLFPSK
ncbi:uncharacterized protein LOC111387195, partial [Olea europaea var. sylvestris]|uniref:uncharacterized protein LOC111387195 n=1 Tax=Olea europaea var. sylvestris TaxID=158386 RepID=UPI000C1D37CB